MSTIPSTLRQELDAWHASGIEARFWWRDDDAVTDTPELRRLLALAEQADASVALAVVPARADEKLVEAVALRRCCVWQHGWRHLWHCDHDGDRFDHGEFGQGRALEAMARDARDGQVALDQRFGREGWQRVFVPPFHALSPAFKPLLASLGYLGLSSGAPLTPAVATVAERNADLDIMNWPHRSFWGTEAVTSRLLEQLVARRTRQVPVEQPIGLLTHHLAHDEEAWSFVAELTQLLRSHAAARLLPAAELFDARCPTAAELFDARCPTAAELFDARCPTAAELFDARCPAAAELAARTSSPSPARAAVPTRSSSLAPARSAVLTMESSTVAAEITVVVTSCGRQDLLEATLDSFLRHNSYPIRQFLVIEDGDGDRNLHLVRKYRGRPFQWLATGARVGQVAAIDLAYEAVETEFIFHCEDDWEFGAPGFVERSLAVLRHNPSILQVWLRAQSDTNGHPVLDLPFVAAGVPYRLLAHHHDAAPWGTWHGFSWNPGLRRRRDYELIGSFGSLDPDGSKRTWQVESDASAFYQERGMFAAILGLPDGAGYVRHIGRGRRVPRLPVGRVAAEAQALAARLELPPFTALIQYCGNDEQPGVDEVPEWQLWTERETTVDQLRIEEQLETMVDASTTILHIGAGNSSLGRRFGARVASVLGTTLHDEERIFAEHSPLANYAVVRANKYSEEMDHLPGSFDLIVDNNPASFACCRYHFARMMVSYKKLLKTGGMILTAEPGLGWRMPGRPADWVLRWADWQRLGQAMGMPVTQLTESVYSMRLTESGDSMQLADAVDSTQLTEPNDSMDRSSANDPSLGAHGEPR